MSLLARVFGPNIEKLKKNRDVDGLVKLLNHQDSRVRLAAISALDDLGNKAAVEPLVAALSDQFPLCRLNAALSLLSLDNAKGRRHLIQMLKDKNQPLELRAATAVVLDQLGNVEGARYLEYIAKDRVDDGPACLRALGHPLGFAVILNTLKNSRDEYVKQYSVKAIELTIKSPVIRSGHRERL